MWQRQAKALASVEKTKSLRNKMEKDFLSILKDFRLFRRKELCMGLEEKTLPQL